MLSSNLFPKGRGYSSVNSFGLKAKMLTVDFQTLDDPAHLYTTSHSVLAMLGFLDFLKHTRHFCLRAFVLAF